MTAFLKNNYLTMTDREIAEKLNLTPGKVTSKKWRLGLFKNKVKLQQG